jgi:hypothetical protein
VKNTSDEIYNFVFRGLLAEEALDKAGRKSRLVSAFDDEEIVKSISLDLLDEDLVKEAKKMSVVYTAINAFENSVRQLISQELLQTVGANWWESCVSEKIRDRAKARIEEEKNIRWHAQRGNDPINYTMLGDLINIIRNNWDKFEPYIQSIGWAESIFDVLERSRNVIMHGGNLEKADIDRIGMNIRDWVKQVGA